MKPLRFLLGLPLLYVLAISTSTSFVSCKKTVTIYDTTIRIEHDTTIKPVHDTTIKTIHDTIIINDTIYDLGSGLVGYYNFNGGTLKDSSGFGNHITANNATLTTDRFGVASNAYLFDGSSSYMQIPNSPYLNPNAITMFAIVKVNGFYQGTCHANVIIMKGDRDDIQGLYTLRFTDNTACTVAPNISDEKFSGTFGDDLPQGNAAGVSSNETFVQTGQWYYLAFTYDGVTAKFYVNGQLTDSTTKTVSFTPNTHDLFFGKTENSTYPYYFNGAIDEVRIYNRALSATEIGVLYKMKK